MERAGIEEKIREFIEELPYRRVNGESVRDIGYDRIPIWWFFRMKFLKGELPLQSPKHKILVDSILNNRKITLYDRIKSRLLSYLFAKAIKFNEELKIFISRFNRKHPKRVSGRGDIMILAHTNAIIFKNSTSGFEIDRIEGVIRKIREDNELQEYISIVDPISHNSLLNLLKYENLIYGHMDSNLRKNANRDASELHKQWVKIKNKISYESEIDKKIYANFLPTLNLIFSKEMLYLVILYYEAYKKVISERNTKLLVVYAPTGFIILCAIAAADKRNIKTLHIEHGLAGHGTYDYVIDSLYRATDTGDNRNMLIKYGNSPDKIFVTGSVVIDNIARYITNKKEVRGKKRILFALWLSSDFPSGKEWYRKYLRKYLQEMNRVGNVEIIMKLHPRDKDMSFYKSILKELGYNNVEIMKTKGKTQTKDFLWSLIRDSDLVISFGSSVSSEALIIGTPSLIIDLIPLTISSSLITEGIVHISRDEDISKIVKEALYNEGRIAELVDKGNQAISKYLYKIDGKASERVLGVIKELVS